MDNVPVDAVPKTSRAAASRRRVVRVLAWSLWGGGLVALTAGGGKRSSAQTTIPTDTPTATATATDTPTNTPTPTSTPTNTPTPTSTLTPTVTPRCRGEGKPCEGNRECCAGLVCRVTGPGAGRRCSRP